MVKAMYLASLKLAGTLRVFRRENQRESVSKHSNNTVCCLTAETVKLDGNAYTVVACLRKRNVEIYLKRRHNNLNQQKNSNNFLYCC